MSSVRASRVVITLALALAGTLVGTGCGGTASISSGPRTTHARRHGGSATGAQAPTPQPVKLAYHELYSLPAALQDPATADLVGGRFVLLGGLDAADTSTANVVVVDLRGPVRTAGLPGAQHDAQAALLSGKVYVFGGGQFSQYDHILSYDPALNAVADAGVLPSPASDVAVTETGGTAYIVGGFDGSNSLDTIVAWRPGAPARVVAHLPVALRYAAVSAAGGAVLVIGGSTPAGASDAIFRFDPAKATVRRIGRLPHPITHAGAATLGSYVYLVGGRGDLLDAQSSSVWSIDPVTGAVHPAGRLPQPLSDAGVLSVGKGIIVAGGRSTTATQAAVGELVPPGG
jgi:N-acetylneuraminic acid mutarotase